MNEPGDVQYSENDSAPAKQWHAAQSLLEAELLRGLASGPRVRMTATDWDSIRAEVKRRLADGKS